MSTALWCDIDDPETNALGQIGHSFSQKDVDRRHFAQTAQVEVQTGNSYGNPTYQNRQEVTDELDMCGYHWRKQNPFLAKNTPEIPAPPTLADLEKESDDYERGWDAAVNQMADSRRP